MFETMTDFVVSALLAINVWLVREQRTQCAILRGLKTLARMTHPKESKTCGL